MSKENLDLYWTAHDVIGAFAGMRAQLVSAITTAQGIVAHCSGRRIVARTADGDLGVIARAAQPDDRIGHTVAVHIAADRNSAAQKALRQSPDRSRRPGSGQHHAALSWRAPVRISARPSPFWSLTDASQPGEERAIKVGAKAAAPLG